MGTFPTGAISTDNVDQTTDIPSSARSDLYIMILKLNAVINSYNKALGIAPLDANGLLPLGNLPSLLEGKVASPASHNHVMDDITDLTTVARTFRGALVSRMVNYEVMVHPTEEPVAFDSLLYDTEGSMFNANTDPWDLVIPAGVSKVRMLGQVAAVSSFDTTFAAIGWKNGVRILNIIDYRYLYPNVETYFSVYSPTISVTPGDSIELGFAAYQYCTVMGSGKTWLAVEIME